MTARTSTVAIGLLALGAAACGAPTSGDEVTPPSPGQPGQPGQPPPPPPLVKSPDPDQITNELGVFVSPTGTAEGDGTQERPLNTISVGVERARATGKIVYVCSGSFKEAITLARGIPVIGGLDCATHPWKLGSVRTRLEAPTSPALRASDIDHPTRVEGFDIVAPDGTPEAPTSIGFLAQNAGPVTLARSSISAGKGHDGAVGEDGIQLTHVKQSSGAGEPPAYNQTILREGGSGEISTCVGAAGFPPNPGGRGGKGGNYLSGRCGTGPVVVCHGGPDTLIWRNQFRVYIGDVYVATEDGVAPSNGEPEQGAPAVAGTDGVSATAAGRFSTDGFLPADGTAGSNGTSGRGGAGGKGATMMPSAPNGALQEAVSAGGPGGGSGGCPGLAGKAGRGGGASLGALLANSAGLIFDAVDITSGKGGSGGKGAFGSSPTFGSSGASPQQYASAPSNGEVGGRSGVSGSGAGGSSVGIAATGGEPTRTTTTIKVGEPGAGVPEEKKPDGIGTMKTLPASVAGEAKELLLF